MKLIERFSVVAIPALFLFAAIGMLFLRAVELAPGSFYEQIALKGDEWRIGHLFLLLSTVFIMPAALRLRMAVVTNWAGHTASVMLFLILPTSVLLAGQYAIDFVVPLLVSVGGEALKVHSLLYQSDLINTLFYGLPNLVFLALMILSMTLIPSRLLSNLSTGVLILNWLAVLIGNLIDPTFQRLAILLLAFSYLPLVRKLWKEVTASLRSQ